ncbi:putative lysozyme-like protein [Anopheles aquasalis]|uniref:putative lysozyme-like protein n=1 Tax=Anopheles aquasalis TaxID=42839 RepID=UPI00215B4C0A|nr:putative lysozyme-like protein [Anopheles aquasalis]
MAAAALSSLMATTSQFTQFQNTFNFVSGAGAIVTSSAASTSSHISTSSAASVSSTRSSGAGDGLTSSTSGGGGGGGGGAGTTVNNGANAGDSTSSEEVTGTPTLPGGNVNTFDSTLAALAATTASQIRGAVESEGGSRKMRQQPPDLPAILMHANLLEGAAGQLNLLNSASTSNTSGDRSIDGDSSSSGLPLRHHDDTTVSVVDDEAT